MHTRTGEEVDTHSPSRSWHQAHQLWPVVMLQPLAWRPSIPPPLHTALSVGTVPLIPSNVQDPQVCGLVHCKVSVFLQFLYNPSVSGTDQVCFWLLFVNFKWSDFMSLCVFLPPFHTPHGLTNLCHWPGLFLPWPPLSCVGQVCLCMFYFVDPLIRYP